MAITAAQVKELRDATGAGMMDCKKALTECEGNFDKAVDWLREKGISKAAKKAGRIAAEGLVKYAFNEDHTQACVVEFNTETDFAAKNPELAELTQNLADMGLAADKVCEKCILEMQYGDEGTVQDVVTAKIAKIGENMSVRRIVKAATPGVKYVGYLHATGKIAVVIGLKTEASFEEIAVCGKDVAMQAASMRPQFVNEAGVDAEYLAHEKEVIFQQTKNESPDKPDAIIEKMIIGRLKKSLQEVCLVDQKFVKDSSVTVAQYVAGVAKEIGKPVEVVEMIRYEVGEGMQKREENFAEEVAKQMAGL